MPDHTFSRRDLLKGAASAATLLGISGRLPAQTASLRTPRAIPPGEKLNIACVGCGGKGATDVREVSSENIVALGNIALLTGRKLQWDAANLRITNVPEANDYLRPKYREGWGV